MDKTNRNTALSSALVEELRLSGLRHVCIAPGSRSAPLALAFWNDPEVTVFSHVDERSAGYFAIGLAQQSGLPAAVLTTSGTAAANLYPAVIEASEARVPLVVITADRPPELRDTGAGQTIDQLKLYGGFVRWFFELGVQQADDTGLTHFRSVTDRAFATALGPQAGPVHLNVPLQEPLHPEPVSGDVTANTAQALQGGKTRPLTSVTTVAAKPSDEIVEELASAISGHSHGVIVAGRMPDPSLRESVSALSAATGYPILAEPTSQLRSGSHDLRGVIAHYDLILRNPPEVLSPDLIIRVGDMPTSKALRLWLKRELPTQIVLDPSLSWHEPTKVADRILRLDPKATFEALAGTVSRGENDWIDRWIEADNVAKTTAEEFFQNLGDELFEPKVHSALAEHIPDGSTVYVASSMPVRDLEAFFPSLDRDLLFLCNRGANGIDGLVSSGLGAAAAAKGRTYILTGDLSLYHDMNGLLAAQRYDLDATIIVFNNGGGGIFSYLPIADYRNGWEELFGTPTRLDFTKIAALYGLNFSRVESYGDLEQAIERPGLVEVPLERERSVELHQHLYATVSAAVSKALPG